MPAVGIIRKGDRVPRAIWKALDPVAKLVMLANGQVGINDDGLPEVRDEVLASVITDVEAAVHELAQRDSEEDRAKERREHALRLERARRALQVG